MGNYLSSVWYENNKEKLAKGEFDPSVNKVCFLSHVFCHGWGQETLIDGRYTEWTVSDFAHVLRKSRFARTQPDGMVPVVTSVES